MPVRLDDGAATRPGMRPAPASARAAAVLVLVTPDHDPAGDDAEAEIVLIERVDHGGHHSGEISFPGGRAERHETPAETAVREAEEEVGLDPARVGLRVIGPLERFWIPISNYGVQPILAIAARRPGLVASPDEVASIIRAPLEAFLPGSPIEIVERSVRGWQLRFGAYRVGGHLVWGATARVLGQLGALLG